MALVQRASGPPHVDLPPEYLNIHMRKDEKFKDFYWRVRTLEKSLGFQPDTTGHQAAIELWLSRLTANLFHKLRVESKGTLKFETVYHLFERCCSIECQDRVKEMRQMMSIRFNFARVGNWALFEAEVDNREELLGYFDIDDPGELSERRRIDSWLVRLNPADLELLRIYTNGLENIKTENELLGCLRQVEFGQKWEALVLNPQLSRYWWEIKVKDMAPKQEAATQSVDDKGRRQKSLAAEGDDGGHEQAVAVAAFKKRFRKNKKSHHAQEEDEDEERDPSPPAVEEKTRKRKKSCKIKEEVDEQVALPPVVEEKPRKRKKKVHFEDDEEKEEQEESPPTHKDKSRRSKGRKAEDDEEVVPSSVVKKKSRKGKKSRRAEDEDEDEDEDGEQHIPTPAVKAKSRKRKNSRRIEDEDEQLASPPATKHKSRKRKRGHHVEVDSDDAEADSSDVDEKPRKRKKIRSERREKHRG